MVKKSAYASPGREQFTTSQVDQAWIEEVLELDGSPLWIRGKEVIDPVLFVDLGGIHSSIPELPVSGIHIPLCGIEEREDPPDIAVFSLTETEKHVPVFQDHTISLPLPYPGTDLHLIEFNDLIQMPRTKENDP